MGDGRHFEELSDANEQLVGLRFELDAVDAEIQLRSRKRQDATDLLARREQIDFEMEMLFQKRRALIASINFSRPGQ